MTVLEKIWLYLVIAWCWLTNAYAVWLSTKSLAKTRWLCIARPSFDPWERETRLWIKIRIDGNSVQFWLNDDGTISSRVREMTNGKNKYIERKYVDQWMHVSKKERAYYTLRNNG